jgi:hypothetical protein
MATSASAAGGCGGRSVRSLGSGPDPSAGAGGSPTAAAGGGVAMGGAGASSGGSGGLAGNASGGSGASAGAAGSDPACFQPIALEPLPAAIEFLVDSSGSLREPWVDDTTRWQFVRDALVDSFSSMPTESATGLVFYPNVQWSAGIEGEGDDFCLLTYESAPIAELSDAHRSELLDAVEQQPTLGATPTYDAYEYAISRLVENSADRRAKAAVLVTDGAPTYADGCVGDGVTPVDGEPLGDAARDAFLTHGIRTFVIGISGGFESLSEMALAGRTARPGCGTELGFPCHFDASTSPSPAAFLESALSRIEREARRCVLAAPESAPENADFTLIKLVSPSGESTLLQHFAPGADCAEGIMHFEDSGTYVLCPETCSYVAAASELRVELQFGCSDPPTPGSK